MVSKKDFVLMTALALTYLLLLTEQYLFSSIIITYLQLPLFFYFFYCLIRYGKANQLRMISSIIGASILIVHLLYGMNNDVNKGVAKSSSELSILSYNIYFKNQYKDGVVNFINREQTDVVCLQEVTPTWEKLLKRKLNYPYKFAHPAISAHGMAVFSKYPIKLLEVVKNKRGRPIAEIFTLQKGGTNILMVNVHLASPAGALADWKRMLPLYQQNFNIRRSQYRRIMGKLESYNTRYSQQLLIGDLNTHRAEPLYDELRTSWRDEYRRHHILPGPTFPYVHKFNLPILTLDYIFSRGAVWSKDTRVLKAGTSDHLPMKSIVTF